ncbi:MAG: peroxiredoxin [Planctomycetota bacterium]|jgi:peroxiredoxin
MAEVGSLPILPSPIHNPKARSRSTLMWFSQTLLLLAALSPLAKAALPPSPLTTSQEVRVDLQEEGIGPELLAELQAEAEAFNAMHRRFVNEWGGHYFEVQELREAGAQPSEYPVSPVLTFVPAFTDLAEAGNGAAMGWLTHFSETIHKEDGLARKALVEKYMTKMADEHASGSYWIEGIEDLKRYKKLLGEEAIFKMLHTLQDTSRHRKVSAEAYYMEASMLIAKGGNEDPERLARAEGIWLILVDGFTGTEASKLAGSPLFNILNREMRAGITSWLDEVWVLVDAGIGPEAWPATPVTSYTTRIQTIAATGHRPAQKWVRVFLPAYEQSLRESTQASLGYLAGWYTRTAGQSNEETKAIKFGLLKLLYRQFPSGDSTFKTIELLERFVTQNYPEDYVPLLDVLIENTKEDRLRYEALTVKGRVLTRGLTLEELNTGMQCFLEVAEDSPLEAQRTRAEDLARDFSWVMPGAEHPFFTYPDVEGIEIRTSDYNGKAFLLYFWSIYEDNAKEDLQWVNEFYERYSDDPVTVLGINGDLNTRESFAEVAAKHGINWRNAMLQKRFSHLSSLYKVTRYPTAILVDADGIIRGRGLDHEEVDALAVKLLAEMGVSKEGLSTAPGPGRLRGTVLFGGKPQKLPELTATPEQLAECSSPNSELDLTDRSLLASEDGRLANVAIWIEVPGDVSSGLGKSEMINERHCRFEPHVLQVAPGSTLWLRNSDSVSRIIGAKSVNNKNFQIIQAPGDQYKTVVKSADQFKITSDSHPWMSCWVVVSPSSFRTLSNSMGAFEIEDLPPGEYVAHWWHESLGSGDSAPFTIKSGAATQLDLSIGGE